jgi:hypothetical protein
MVQFTVNFPAKNIFLLSDTFHLTGPGRPLLIITLRSPAARILLSNRLHDHLGDHRKSLIRAVKNSARNNAQHL